MYSEEQMKIIMENEETKKLYGELLKMDLKVRLADAQLKYDGLVTKKKEDAGSPAPKKITKETF